MESNEHVSKRRKKEDVPCDASDKSISLSVRSLDGRTMEFTVTAGSAVRKLKDRIAESVGVPPGSKPKVTLFSVLIRVNR